MKKKTIISVVIILLVVVGVTGFYSQWINGPYISNGEILMYGVTDASDLAGDVNVNSFIKEETGKYSTREAASQHHMIEAASELARDDSSAVVSLNYSWILNPNDYQPYVGFAILLYKENDLQGTRRMWNLALEHFREIDTPMCKSFSFKRDRHVFQILSDYMNDMCEKVKVTLSGTGKI